MRDEKYFVAAALRRLGASLRQISVELRVSRSTVAYNLARPPPSKRVTKERTVSLSGKQKRRKEVLSRLLRTATGFPSCAALAAEMRQEGITVSRDTVRLDLRRLGLVARVRPVVSGWRPGDDERRLA